MAHHTKFVWDDSYSVQVQEMDEQHQQFFDAVNQIYDLLENDKATNRDLIAAISQLGNYAHYHLTDEEEYFKKFDYEEADIHVKQHDAFRKVLEKYMGEAEGQGPDADIKKITEELATFAKDWLANHIFVSDKRYIECFHQHGLN